ncbi:probable translation initiation factor eIF-2B subunit delta isoform X2 [Nymphaea colorata]|uniref:probable translation initiation factor eIF-2B subunit delta isoform X2 n=1 Tax=Nymphaea colorata TaxID=210225 RepID=UPI00129DBCA6|nr:probable translation initiation factor eIF-2B subunit delta isoform X2 [Nymphaea colorata]
MDSRRVSRAVIDPKVRHVGFVTASEQMHSTLDDAITEGESPSIAVMSPVGNSLSPVMIPPPRHPVEAMRAAPVPVLSSPLRRLSCNAPVGSYNPSDNVLGTSPVPSPSRRIESVTSVDFSDSPGWVSRTVSTSVGGAGKMEDFVQRSASLPASGFPEHGKLATVSTVKPSSVVIEDSKESERGNATNSKPLKERTSKAERRALQEAQRAAKAAAKETGINRGNTAGGGAPTGAKPSKDVKSPPPSKKKDGASTGGAAATSDRKAPDRLPEKEKKKDVPPPRMQFDDTQRVEKAKKRALVKQTESRNRVELFRHLPQYVHGTLLPDLEAKFFHSDHGHQMHPHPAVYKVGLQYLSGDIAGGNARCVAMLSAFQEAIKDYKTPSEKALVRDLTAKINSYVSFLISCRPLSISMGNAIRFLKDRISKLSLTLTESEAKSTLQSDINRFINEKIILADKVIVRHAVTKIRDGDVLLTYGSACVVEMILEYAHELGKKFRVVVVDSRPKHEGQKLLGRLLAKGISCTYTHINAISYVMHEVTRVFLGAASVLSNGIVYSRVGTACVAMVAHAFRVPVLICCEAYKFHERVQLDSICSNELGDPDAISKVSGRKELNHLDNWADKENLHLLNLIYDATPADYVSMIITDYGMIPPTSVPVIVREYGGSRSLI